MLWPVMTRTCSANPVTVNPVTVNPVTVNPLGEAARARTAANALRPRARFRTTDSGRSVPRRAGQFIQGVVEEEADVDAVQRGAEPLSLSTVVDLQRR